jgi:hypothetical protein
MKKIDAVLLWILTLGILAAPVVFAAGAARAAGPDARITFYVA